MPYIMDSGPNIRNSNSYYSENSGISEEDTDDASETEFRAPNATSGNNESNPELKEQIYQHKLATLNRQVEELQQFTHPEYLKRIKKLNSQYTDRLKLNEIYRDYMIECVEKDYAVEKKAALKEYEEKKIDLKDNILSDFEEKKKVIENERFSLELTTDSMEIKPTVTRKLRRRPNDPVPVVEKRRKPPTGQLLVYQLDDKEIENDLKSIQRGKLQPLTPTNQQNGIASYGNSQQNPIIMERMNSYVETRIEDGKLLYERRWFHRGQQVFVEGKDIMKFAATITAIGNDIVWVKKVHDNSKVKINMSHLIKGKVSIKRRAN